MGAFPGAGSPGEYKEAVVSSASAVSLSTGTAKTVTGATLSLAPGEWAVTGVVDFQFAATTSFTALFAGASSVTDTLGGQDTYATLVSAANVPTAANDMGLSLPVIHFAIATTTTIQLVAQAVFSASTLKAYGTLRARRVR